MGIPRWGRSTPGEAARVAEAEAVLREVDGLTGPRSGSLFERWLASLFAVPGSRVTPLGGPGDHGADLMVETAHARTVVQAKHSSSGPVGERGVCQVNAARKWYLATGALVVSNQEFTAGAKALARACDVELWGRQRLWEALLEACWMPGVPCDGDFLHAAQGNPVGSLVEHATSWGGGRDVDAGGGSGYPVRLAAGLLWRFALVGAIVGGAFVDTVAVLAAVVVLLGSCFLVGVCRGQDRAAPIWRAGAIGIGLAVSSTLSVDTKVVIAGLSVLAVDALIAAGRPWWSRLSWPWSRGGRGSPPRERRRSGRLSGTAAETH